MVLGTGHGYMAALPRRLFSSRVPLSRWVKRFHSGAKRARAFLRLDAARTERETNMGAFIRFRERIKLPSGQTMTEYALILATIAVVLISLYNTAGTLLKTLVDQVNPML